MTDLLGETILASIEVEELKRENDFLWDCVGEANQEIKRLVSRIEYNRKKIETLTKKYEAIPDTDFDEFTFV